MDEKRTKRRYTREFKLEAVNLVKEREGRVTEVSNNLSIHPVMLHHQIKEYSDDSKYTFLAW